MKYPACLLLAWMLPGWLPAQQDVPFLRPEERKVVDGQSKEFYQVLAPTLATAAKSTVRIWAGKRRLAYGTVVGDGNMVLTKFSELTRVGGGLRVEAGDGTVRSGVVTGVYQDEDLAVLTVQGGPLVPVKWHTREPKLGNFLTAPQPGGQPAAFGVVSVLERNLRETDKAYLGVMGDLRFEGPGVKVQEVSPDSGAAAAGLRQGDVILRVGKRQVSGMLELRNALTAFAPDSRVPMDVSRGEEKFSVEVLLGNRPDIPQMTGERLRQMEQMGGRTSQVRGSFSKVIQSDMRPAPDQIGGPVVDLQGRVVGITMARADRTRSFVMPSAAVAKLLESQPLAPALAKAALPEPRRGMPQVPGGDVPQGSGPGDLGRLRRHRDDLQRLMERMQEEMLRLEERKYQE